MCRSSRAARISTRSASGLKLIIEGGEKIARMPATDDPARLRPQDYVVVALKAHQAWEAAEQMKPLLGPNTAVVTAQNGVPWWYFHGLGANSKPAARQRRSRRPPMARHRARARHRLHRLSGDRDGRAGRHQAHLRRPASASASRPQDDGAAAALRRLRGGRPQAAHLPEIRNDIWLKLWGNLCFNPISALTRATLDVVATDPGTRASRAT